MSPSPSLDDANAEALILNAADDLFYREGVAGVTMAQIRDEAGVSMRRLYGLHPSKTELIARWLEHRHRTWTVSFTDRTEQRMSEGEPIAEAAFAAIEDWMRETDFRGCGFINTHAEVSELTSEHRSIIRAHKASLADYLSSHHANGAALAVLLDGAIVQAAIFGNVRPIVVARAAAMTFTA